MKDYFGKDASNLKNKKLWLLDLDGTIYNEERLFDGALDLLRKIVFNRGHYVFITNNSSKSIAEHVEKARRLNIPANKNNFFTSTQATILWINEKMPGSKVYCQGTKSLVRELQRAGIVVTEDVEPVDVVLVGFDTELNTEKLRNTCEILTTQDVVFLATNPDLVCPVCFGYVPDCGSICEIIYNSTGKEPMYIGKPEPLMVDAVRLKYNIEPDDTVMIGDRLYTDIASGLNAGVTAICVLTGEANTKDIESGDIKPTLTFESVREIADCL